MQVKSYSVELLLSWISAVFADVMLLTETIFGGQKPNDWHFALTPKAPMPTNTVHDGS